MAGVVRLQKPMNTRFTSFLSWSCRAVCCCTSLLLLSGANAPVALRASLSLPIQSTSNTRPAEEEERHAEPTERTRLQHRRVALRHLTSFCTARWRSVTDLARSWAPTSAFFKPPDTGHELRNGLGGPLIC
jgi:hypothetical protein